MKLIKINIFWLVIFAFCSFLAAQTSRTNEIIQKPTSNQNDILNPRHFMLITEYDNSLDSWKNPHIILGRKLTVSTRKDSIGKEISDTTQSHLYEIINAEVDKDSKILIQFDRDKIKAQENFEAEITIEGSIGSRGIEIPGYSEVGEQKKIATAKIRSLNSLKSIFSELKILYEKHISQFMNKLREKGFISGNFDVLIKQGVDQDKIQELLEFERTISKYKNEKIVVQPYLDSLKIKKQLLSSLIASAANDTLKEKAKNDSTILESKISSNEINLANLDTLINDIQRKKNDILRQIELEDEQIKTQVSYLIEINNTIDEISIHRHELFVPLKAIINENEQLLKIILENSSFMRHYEAFISGIDRVMTTEKILMKGLLSSRDIAGGRVDSVLTVLKLIDNNLSQFGILSHDLEDRIKHQNIMKKILLNLKDTELSLTNIDAKAGDLIRIEITNSVQTIDQLPRKLTVNLKVKDFGAVQHISDSFLFLKQRYNEPQINHSRTLNQSDSVKTSEGNQFIPSPGVTFGWTFHSRKTKCLWKEFLRWIEPGFGINVSFPNFKTRSQYYQNKTSINPDSSVTSEQTLIVGEPEGNLDIGTGMVISIFNEQLYGTFGFILTSKQGKYRHYYGIGFSFVNLARKILK